MATGRWYIFMLSFIISLSRDDFWWLWWWLLLLCPMMLSDICLSDICLSDVCRIHPVRGQHERLAGWMACIGWLGPARPAWLKAAAACFHCRPGRGISWWPPTYSLLLLLNDLVVLDLVVVYQWYVAVWHWESCGTTHSCWQACNEVETRTGACSMSLSALWSVFQCRP